MGNNIGLGSSLSKTNKINQLADVVFADFATAQAYVAASPVKKEGDFFFVKNTAGKYDLYTLDTDESTLTKFGSNITDFVGVGCVYATKEDIPASLRHEFIETTDKADGIKWRLEGGILDVNWVKYKALGSLTKDHVLIGNDDEEPSEEPVINEWTVATPTQEGEKERNSAQINFATDSSIIASVHNIAPININVKDTLLIPYLAKQSKKFILFEAYFIGLTLITSGSTDVPNIKLIAGKGETGEKVLFDFDVNTSMADKKNIIPLLATSDELIDLDQNGGISIDITGGAWSYGDSQLIIKGQII